MFRAQNAEILLSNAAEPIDAWFCRVQYELVFGHNTGSIETTAETV
jgi:hypothetical protein